VKTVNIHEAKTHLSRLLKRVAAGEEIVIARAGTPVARLVRAGKRPLERGLGTQKGRFQVPNEFNEPLPEEILSSFQVSRE
jgi:prevent-host-death family protein